MLFNEMNRETLNTITDMTAIYYDFFGADGVQEFLEKFAPEEQVTRCDPCDMLTHTHPTGVCMVCWSTKV